MAEEQPLLSQQHEERAAPGYSPLTGFGMLVNAIIGLGVLTLPYAFFRAGLLLSVCTMVVFAAVLLLTAFWLLEVYARGNGYDNLLHGSDAFELHDCATMRNAARRVNHLSAACPEYVSVSEMFGGPFMKTLVTCCLLFSICAILWLYSTVFAVTAADLLNVWFGWATTPEVATTLQTQLIFVYGFFGLLLTLIGLTEQGTLQLCLTFMRAFCFTAMLLTAVWAWCTGGRPAAFAEPAMPMVSWDGFGFLFSSSSFALASHFGMREVIMPVRDKRRGTILTVCTAAWTLSTVFYLLVGVVLGMFFGAYAKDSVVSNWSTYLGLSGGWTTIPNAPKELSGVIITTIVQLYPILALVFNFPLIASPAAETYKAYIKKYPSALKTSPLLWPVSCVIAVVPPILLSLWIRDLKVIMSMEGVALFVLVYFAPCIMFLFSRKMMRSRFGPHSYTTVYAGWYSKQKIVKGVLLFSVISFVFYCYTLF